MSQYAYPNEISVTYQTSGRQYYTRKFEVANATVGDIAKAFIELSGSKNNLDDTVLLYIGSQIKLNDQRNVKELFRYDIFPMVIACPA